MTRRRWGGAALVVAIVAALTGGVGTPAMAAVAPTVPLGTTAEYAVLGASTVTNTGESVLDGSLGVWPGTSITGFPPGRVLIPGAVESSSPEALRAQTDLTAAYVDAAGRPIDATTTAALGDLTLVGGVYSGPGKSPLTLSGPLVLDGAGDPTSVFVFQTDSTLITASNSTVTLVNGAQECNVFWIVGSSATLGTGSDFAGNILALGSVTVMGGATVHGRALASSGAVTLDTNTFMRPSCDTTPVVTTAAPSQMIVTAASVSEAHDLVVGVDGAVIRALPIIDGVLAELTSPAAAVLSDVPGVVVTPNVAVRVMSDGDDGSRTPAAVFAEASGATRLAEAGNDGSGINVAVLDTGISAGPDFDGRLVAGVDLSGEGNAFHDSYGHGTFVAGLIAGDGASSAGRYAGEAPGAGLVAVKVAGRTGITDLATVIEGVQWTVSNRAPLDIRVLNISLGVDLDMPTTSNPLDRAVQRAWNAGLVVVVSAGNDGPTNGTILSPGDAPAVITVGALDDNGSVAAADDTMTSFSSVGPTRTDGWFKPDLVASGRSVVSVRAASSTIDLLHPDARIGEANFVGSGSSFSAAITAGAAALVIGAHPSARPDDVKARLLAAAAPGPVGNPFVDGHGVLDAYAAATNPPNQLSQRASPPTSFAEDGSVSLGRTWERSSWNPAMWSTQPWTGSAWNGSAWVGSAWNGSAWNGSAWVGSAWNGSAWVGSAWNGSAWVGSAWNGSTWK